ncbi:MAG: hypothetical protein GPOALKHO_001022 [Sodalis sp.]|nr:MAG: hypothetical protein GPOALKHO_001022 [Sodalis sp.]
MIGDDVYQVLVTSCLPPHKAKGDVAPEQIARLSPRQNNIWHDVNGSGPGEKMFIPRRCRLRHGARAYAHSINAADSSLSPICFAAETPTAP